MSSLVDLYVVYRILRKLTTPFNKWEAFKTGVIDAQGNILKSSKERTLNDEQQSFNKFDLMILKLKKLLEKIPGGKNKFASYAAALLILREGEEIVDDEKLLEEKLEEYINDEYLMEDAPTNNVGGGNVKGMDGDGPSRAKSKKVRRKKFAGHEVFVVDTGRYMKSRFGKKKHTRYENYIGNDEVADAIREYSEENPSSSIILQDETTGAMLFLKYGKKHRF
jgi:hypothetical protein